MLPAQVRNRDATLSLADHTHNLCVSKAITLHQNLLILTLRKFSFKSHSFYGGITFARSVRGPSTTSPLFLHETISWTMVISTFIVVLCVTDVKRLS
jgi:hypothetical protein